MWGKKKDRESTEEERINSVGEGDQGKQKEKANKQNCLKLYSSTLCVLANKHFGNPFFFFLISGTLFGSVTRHGMLSQAAILQPNRGQHTSSVETWDKDFGTRWI